MTDPVSVEGENVIYKAIDMEEGKLYEIVWKGEKWALKKTDKGIEFLLWKEK
jgi:hypothetical protein